jgi:hypothetical protein
MTITLGQVDMNIQLGAEPQGAMIAVNTVITNGIDITNFALRDGSSGEAIAVAQFLITDAGGTDLTVADVTVDVEAAGLVISMNDVGSVSGVSLQMIGVQLGSAPVIGDIEIIGLQLSGTTITVAGKN